MFLVEGADEFLFHDDSAAQSRIRLIEVVVKPAHPGEIERARIPTLSRLQETDAIDRWTFGVHVHRIGDHRMRARVGVDEGHMVPASDSDLLWCDAGSADGNRRVPRGCGGRGAARGRHTRSQNSRSSKVEGSHPIRRSRPVCHG